MGNWSSSECETLVGISKAKRKSIISGCNSMCKVPGFGKVMALNAGIVLKPSMARDWKKSRLVEYWLTDKDSQGLNNTWSFKACKILTLFNRQ